MSTTSMTNGIRKSSTSSVPSSNNKFKSSSKKSKLPEESLRILMSMLQRMLQFWSLTSRKFKEKSNHGSNNSIDSRKVRSFLMLKGINSQVTGFTLIWSSLSGLKVSNKYLELRQSLWTTRFLLSRPKSWKRRLVVKRRLGKSSWNGKIQDLGLLISLLKKLLETSTSWAPKSTKLMRNGKESARLKNYLIWSLVILTVYRPLLRTINS